MNRPFLKSLNGKFVSRTVLLTFIVSLVIGGLAFFSMRSLSNTANDAVAAAQANNASEESIAPLMALADDVSSTSSTLMLLLLIAIVGGAIVAGALASMFAQKITQPITSLRSSLMQSAAALPEALSTATSDDPAELPLVQLKALLNGKSSNSLVDFLHFSFSREPKELAQQLPEQIVEGPI